jgi:ABC-type transporter Mla subunit MlaD
MSAEIIPFRNAPAARPSRAAPGRAKSGPATPRPAMPTVAGEDRLQRALAALDAAVTGQRAAVAEWRRSLEQLGTTMKGLGTSLGRYRDSLTHLEGKVGSLNHQAAALEQLADRALAAEEGQAPAAEQG